MLRVVALSRSFLMVTMRCGEPDERAIRATLTRLFPERPLTGLKLFRSAIPTLFKVELGGETFYTTVDGKHVLFGEAPQLVRLFAREKMPFAPGGQ
jgi:hypothetical protein